MSYWRGAAHQPGPDRPVHVERLEERDARVPAGARPQRDAPAGAAAGAARRRALRLGPPGRRPRAAAGGPHRGRPRRGDAARSCCAARCCCPPTAGWTTTNPANRPARADHPAQPGPSARLALAGAPLLDDRPDAERPTPIRARPSTTPRSRPSSPTRDQVFAALQTIAARHQSALDRMRNARQMMFRSNFGMCRFTTERRRDHRRPRGVHVGARPGDAAPGARPLHGPEAPLGPVVEPPPDSCASPRSSRVPIPAAPTVSERSVLQRLAG